MARLDPSWLRFAPFTLSGVLTALALLGLGWRITDQAQLDAGHSRLIRSAADHLRQTPLWVDVAQLGLVVLITVSLLSVLGYLLAFWNFRLTRHSEGTLQVSRGLITTPVSVLNAYNLCIQLTIPPPAPKPNTSLYPL